MATVTYTAPDSQVKLAAQYDISTAAAADVTGMAFAVTSGVWHHIRFFVPWQSTNLGVALRLGITHPGVASTDNFSGRVIAINQAASNANAIQYGWLTSSGDMSGIPGGVTVIDTTYMAVVDVLIKPNANGNVQLRAASSTDTVQVSAMAGATGMLWTGPNATVVKSATQSVSSSVTPVDITDMGMAVTSGVRYGFRYIFACKTTNNLTGVRLGITVPATSIFGTCVIIPNNNDGGASTATIQSSLNASGANATGTLMPASNTAYIAEMIGIITPSANGTIQPQFANETAAQTISIIEGAMGFLYTLP